MPHLAVCDSLAVEVGVLAQVVRAADPQTPVHTCDPWVMADLLGHLGQIHRWAWSMVRDLSHSRLAGREKLFGAPAPAGLTAWLVAGGEDLVATLRAADPDAPMWAWGADKHARFWSRRMLHETTLHRADAELALGATPKIDADLAVDGVDEFLDNLPCASHFAPGVRRLRGRGELLWVAPDMDVAWLVELTPDGFTWRHDRSGTPTVTVVGAAADLYLFAWGRVRAGDARLTVSGDRDLLEHWVSNSAL
jgi:uncharacterized protein (TIGR03083 family)